MEGNSIDNNMLIIIIIMYVFDILQETDLGQVKNM